MKMPKRLYIEPFTYTVEQRADWARDTGNNGNCLSDDQRIILEPNLTDQGARDTLLHEALHAIWTQTTLDKKYDDDAEEEIVWTLAPRLLGFLKDNPEFLTWLNGK